MKPPLRLVVPTVIFAVVVLACGWVSDDAFITLRTLEHALQGYGLRWNIDERVQGYTHPLWALLLLAVGAVTREWLITTTLLGVVVSSAAVLLLLIQQPSPSWRRTLWLTALMVLSKSLVSYSTSGLENPLTHLLLAVAFLLHRNKSTTAGPPLWQTALLTCLAMLNRMDLVLLFGPLLATETIKAWVAPRRWRELGKASLAFAPLLAWEAFSLLYYGSLVPNTAYAKLSMGVPQGLLWQQGLRYFEFVATWDPLTLAVIALGLIVPLARRQWRHAPWVLGMTLYLVYVLRIGGDFMAGRFFAAPFFCALLLLGSQDSALDLDLRARPTWALLPLPLLGLFSVAGTPWKWARAAGSEAAKYGVADERVFYYKTTGWLSPDRPKNPEDSYLPGFGAKVRKNGLKIKLEACVGQVAFYAGPTVHVVDVYGLTEPLLARLPTREPLRWRIGHFWRDPPPGYYQDSKIAAPPQIKDPDLAIYYEKLMILAQAPLFAPGRLIEIWRMLGGEYEHHRLAYLARSRR